MATIKLGMDASEVISKQQQINEGAKAHGEHAKNFGEQMEHAATHGLARALTKVIAIKEVLTAIGEAAKQISEDTGNADKKKGGDALKQGADFRSLGVADTAGLGEAYKQTEGTSTLSERQAFLGKLASANRERRIKFTQKEVKDALFAYAKGGETVFGEGGGDLIKSLERHQGIKSTAEIDKELAGTSEDEKKEFATRNFERQAELRKEDALTQGDKGVAARRAKALLEAKRAEEETNGTAGFLKTVGRHIPGVKDAIEATEQYGQEQQKDQLGLGGGNKIDRVLGQIAGNTKPQPQLNLTGHSE